jgi:hypothetical protein
MPWLRQSDACLLAPCALVGRQPGYRLDELSLGNIQFRYIIEGWYFHDDFCVEEIE